MLKVKEIFDSYQGEGLYIGHPFTFIRLAGCNLNCDFCDEGGNASDNAKDVPISELREYASSDDILITGGEPLLQAAGLERFLNFYKGSTRRIHLETNGSIPIWDNHGFTHIAVSPKAEADYFANASTLKAAHEVKLIADENLTPDAAIRAASFSLSVNKKLILWIQPVAVKGKVSSKTMDRVKHILDRLHANHFPARMGIQAHLYWRVQ